MLCDAFRCDAMVMVGLFGWDGVGWRWQWRCVVMRYDALPWDWVGWDGDGDGGGDGDDVMRCHAMPCHAMPCHEVGLDGIRLDVG